MVLVTTFSRGLKEGEFLFSMLKNKPKTMANILFKAMKYMNAEDALIAQKDGKGKRKRENTEDARSDTKKKTSQFDWRKDDGRIRPPSRQIINFTPLNTPLDQVLMQIGDDPTLKWLEKLKRDPNKRFRDKYCRFHRNHRYDTSNCYELKSQIETLIRKGKLQQFVRDKTDVQPPQGTKHPGRVEKSPRAPLREIKVIVEGSTSGGTSKTLRRIYLHMAQSVQITGQPPKQCRMEDFLVTFIEENAQWLHHPHDDALVMTLTIADYTTRQVLVDNGSSVDILYYPAFQQMKIDKELLKPTNTPLVGFGGMKMHLMGTVTLPITISAYPRQWTKEVDLLVVDCSSAYNAIIGRPTLNALRATTSTYHLLVKFPTKYGVEEARGEQAAARECYITMLNMDE
ncbi:uncharacterized protein LOC112006533 [Quercus suber]|uniref:uncharacterized protein LOC112006533 n=1 Tax=Quercus suber TaxID=58331 RepID=UPI000CE236E3|nr:uncharacterized protein LOC112006533 [Quercus suber]